MVSDPRFVFVLRNPVDRAWSHYQWQKYQKSLETKPFREAFTSDQSAIPTAKRPKNWRNSHYYQTGRYATWLGAYLRTFGRERVLILVFEDFVADPLSQLEAVYDFLGLPFQTPGQPVQSNKTVVSRFPVLSRTTLRLSQTLGPAVQDLLPGSLYSHLVRLHRRSVRALLQTGARAAEVPFAAEDRAWVTAVYEDEVRALRHLAGMNFDAWEADFPLVRDRSRSEVASATGVLVEP